MFHLHINISWYWTLILGFLQYNIDEAEQSARKYINILIWHRVLPSTKRIVSYRFISFILQAQPINVQAPIHTDDRSYNIQKTYTKISLKNFPTVSWNIQKLSFFYVYDCIIQRYCLNHNSNLDFQLKMDGCGDKKQLL